MTGVQRFAYQAEPTLHPAGSNQVDGGTRDDHPAMDANWRNTLLVCKTTEIASAEALVPRVTVDPEEQVPMRPDLLEVFELSELEKYYTDAELTEHPERKG